MQLLSGCHCNKIKEKQGEDRKAELRYFKTEPLFMESRYK